MESARRGHRAVKRLLALWPPLVWLAVFVIAPTMIVVAYSFYDRGPAGVVRAFSWAAWREILTRDTLVLFGRSAWIATISTAACLAIAYPVAYFIAGCGARAKHLLLVLVVLPFWTNFLARNVAMKLIFNWAVGPDFHSMTAVIVGLVYGYLPFMVLPLYVSIEKVPKRLLEAAADLGASPARSFWSVTVPLTAPGIAAGCVLVFIPCFGAFVTPRILWNRGVLGTQIDTLVDLSNWPGASALSLVMMGAVLLLLAIYYRLKRDEGIV
jgi:spermidine/putrescine transport system permease protein